MTVIIPPRDLAKSRRFCQKVFGWVIEEQPGTRSFAILPPSQMDPSAELNPEESVVVPSIRTRDIAEKLRITKKLGRKTLKNETPVDKDAKCGHYALFGDPNGNRMRLYSDE